MILCEKCDKFYFPEFDEDGYSIGCQSPSVIDVFDNFIRLYKCKYYRKISYNNMLKEAKKALSRLLWLNHRTRSNYPIGKNRRIIQFRKDYFNYRDYLFTINKGEL